MFYSIQDSQGFGAGIEVLGDEGLPGVMGQQMIDPTEAAYLTQLRQQQDAQYAAAYGAAAASPMAYTNTPSPPAFQFMPGPQTNNPYAPITQQPISPYTGANPFGAYGQLVASGRRRRGAGGRGGHRKHMRTHFRSMSERGGGRSGPRDYSFNPDLDGAGIDILGADDLLGDFTSSRAFQGGVIAALALGAVGLAMAASHGR